MNTEQVWKDSLEIIKVTVSPAIFSTWFSQTHIISIEELESKAIVEIGCPTSFAKNTIEIRYFGLIQDSLSKVIGKMCDLSFVVKTNPKLANINIESPSPLFSVEKDEKSTLEVLQKARLRPTFTFENFAVSGSNQMACCIACVYVDYKNFILLIKIHYNFPFNGH